MVIDLFGLTSEEVRKDFPEVYQHVKAEVKEKVEIDKDGQKKFVGRDWNNRDTYKNNWWIFGEPRSDLRPALEGLTRYIATVETAKHRIFQFLTTTILPDNKIVCIADQDGYTLGILSSRLHIKWSLRAGGWLGVGNDPVYIKTKVFDPFPFPPPGDILKAKIRAVAEELDAFRKQRQVEHPDLTLTQMYNVLEKLKVSHPLDEYDETIKDKGLILILKELHEKLDELVFEAYGWPPTLTDEQILESWSRSITSAQRRNAAAMWRWLRPDYQIPRFGKKLDKQAAKEDGAQIIADLDLPETGGKKPVFPADPVAQTAAVFAVLATAREPIDARAIAAGFRRTKTLDRTIEQVLEL